MQPIGYHPPDHPVAVAVTNKLLFLTRIVSTGTAYYLIIGLPTGHDLPSAPPHVLMFLGSNIHKTVHPASSAPLAGIWENSVTKNVSNRQRPHSAKAPLYPVDMIRYARIHRLLTSRFEFHRYIHQTTQHTFHEEKNKTCNQKKKRGSKQTMSLAHPHHISA